MLLPTPLQSATIWRTFSHPEPSPNSAFSNPTAQYHAELNQICLQQIQAWLTEIGVSSEPTFTPTQIASIWDVVNGCALTINNCRLILIPSDQLDRDELRVPQEWVDIPAWLGDYYLAVQIDLETNSMNIWGFISHRTLRETGTYNVLDRTYSIDSDFLIADLDILWMTEFLELQEITTVPALPNLALDRSQSLIEQLSHPSPYSPRMDIDFGSWAAILSNHNLREHLYQQRLRAANIRSNPTPPLNLINWLQQEFSQSLEQGWDIVDNFMGKVVYRTPDNMIERAKLINLQCQLQQTSVVMLVGIQPQSTSKVSILVEIHAVSGIPTLPPQLKLSSITDEGQELDTVITRSQDFKIRLHPFVCDLGDTFNIQLQLNGASQIEKFIV
jgi:Protein of unknown function (DUF1822)